MPLPCAAPFEFDLRDCPAMLPRLSAVIDDAMSAQRHAVGLGLTLLRESARADDFSTSKVGMEFAALGYRQAIASFSSEL